MKGSTDYRSAWYRRYPQALLVLTYAAIVALPVLSLTTASGWADEDILSRSGDGLLIIAFSLLALQPVLAARFKVLDRAFGLDVVYVFHKTMGMTAGLLQTCATVFMVAGLKKTFSWTGEVATALVVLIVLSALLHRELHLTYEAWRRLHNGLFIGLLIVLFGQAWSISMALHSLLTGVMTALLLVLGISAYIHHKVTGPAARRRMLYHVANVQQEARNVWTLTLRPPEGAVGFDYMPGQFQFLAFASGKGEEHPFTISSSPTQQGYHTATIKGSGDFTRTVGQVKAGAGVSVQAPFGHFSHAFHPEERDLVFIAGGIGITPFMSMLRYMHDGKEDYRVLLLYANNTEEDIVFRQELDRMASSALPELRVVHVLGRAGETWRGERGVIDRSLIERYVPGELRNKTFYLCGPPPMMAALIALLSDLGVSMRSIRSERFAL